MEEPLDKRALLGDLKIDRAAPPRQRFPVKTFLAIAVLGGAGGYFGWVFGLPLVAAAGEVEVETALARAQAPSPAGDSVLDATGYVVARRRATVSAKTTGKVVEVLVEEGMVVEKGQLLAVLDDSIPQALLAIAESQVDAARASLAEIRVDIEQAELNVVRTGNLAERNLASLADLDRDRLALAGLKARLERVARDIEVAERSLALERRQLDDMRIVAPFGGVVVAKAAQPGEMISPVSAGGGFTRTGICTIVDMGSLEVEVDVNEAYINRVYAKQPATATLNAYPDFEIPAEVIATIPAADRNKATVRVRIGFLLRDARILPDMGVRVAFLDEREPGAGTPVRTEGGVWAPSAALRDENGERYVWVVADGAAQRRAVALDAERGGRARIADGLAAGERVVVGPAEIFAELRPGIGVVVVR